MPRLETPPCLHCGKKSVVELTDEEFRNVTDPNGPLIQVALPARSADFREMIMTGTHSKCWNDMFGDES